MNSAKIPVTSKQLITGAAVFLFFVVAATLKVAVFNNLIVDNGAFVLGVPALFNKLLLVGLIVVFLTRPRRWYWLAGFYAVQALYMFVNLSYHFSFEGYLHISQYAGLSSEAFDLVKYSALPHDPRLWCCIADLPALACMLLFYGRWNALNRRAVFKPSLYCAGASLIACVHGWDPSTFAPRQTMNDPYASDISVVKSYGLLTFNLTDLFNYPDSKARIRSLAYGPEVSAQRSDGAPPNVVVIQIESLDASVVDRTVRGVYVTPFLHGLSHECMYFPYMVSYHEAGSTSDCEFATINSVEPFDDFPSIKIRNYDYPNSLVKRLSEGSYATAAFHGNRGSYFNRSVAFKRMGFDKLYDMDAMGLSEISWGAPDGSVFDFVKTLMRSQSAPFFYYIITMSSHEPFTLVKPYYHTDAFASAPGAARDYYTAMSYADREIKSIVSDIRNARPDTYVFLYGDHTPLISRDFYKRATLVQDNRLFEFVPLFIITPDRRAYRESACVASFMDIAPTILDASGVAYRFKSSGANLLSVPLADGTIAYRNGVYSRAELFRKISRAN